MAPSPQVAPAKSGGGLTAVKILAILIPLILLLIAGAVVWFLFFKPMDPNDYEAKVEDEMIALEEGVAIMGDSAGEILIAADGGISAGDLKDLRAEYNEGTRMARTAASELAGLREPDEYSRAHRDLLAYVEFARDEVVDPLSEVVGAIAEGDESAAIGEDLQQVMERASNETPRMEERLASVKEELFLPDDLAPLAGIKMQPCSVTLSWTDPVDFDLGATDGNGNDVGYLKNQDALADAVDRSETLEFTTYSDADLTSGTYDITAYYAGMGDTSLQQANVTLTLTLPTGAQVEFSRMISYDSASDMWHVISLDSATGEYEELGWTD